jgi:hypothetical protein
VLEAELTWVRGVVADLHEGRLTWSEEWLRQIGSEIGIPHESEQELE